MNKLVANVIRFAGELAAEKLSAPGTDFLSVRAEGGMYITLAGIDFSKITEQDVVFVAEGADTKSSEFISHAAIYAARPDIGAIVHTHPMYSSVVADAGLTIPPVLDDMAQIVGPSAKLAADFSAKQLLKALKGRNAALVKKDGIITTGRTPDEAFTACLVLDKAACCYIEGSVVGGVKKIKAFEAALMHFVYKKKYSKKDQDKKLADLKGGEAK